MKYDAIVIGGGAAGLFAAGLLEGKRVLVLEHSDRLGKKLRITGKGRCNVTNHCPPEEVLKNIPRNGRFLYSALWGFPPESVVSYFEALGCVLKTERGNRVFPESDRAETIVNALTGKLKQNRVTVVRESVKELLIEDGAVSGVRTERGDYEGQTVLLCTGGCSYPLTGSDGSGYALAKQAGHTVVEPVGSLVPLTEDGDTCKKMQGLSLRNVTLTLQDGKGKRVFEDFGELLFTHFGLSGPIVLSASAHMKQGETYRVVLDLKPALSEEQLEQRILRDFAASQNKNFGNVLGGLFPSKLIPVMAEKTGIQLSEKVNEVTKEQRRVLIEQTKHFAIEILGKRPVEEAIVTSGGVCVREVNPKTMESKLVSGLYFAGEVLDVDAYTGGFNLQIAWSTAFAAANAMLEQIK